MSRQDALWLAMEAQSLADTVEALTLAAGRLSRQMALLQRAITDTAPPAVARAGRAADLRLIPGGKQ